MKKLKTVLTAIVMLFTISSFATGPEKVSPVVKAAFENDFSKAILVNWEKTSDYYFASFLLNDVNVEAAYDEAGKLVGTSRRISMALVPLSISLAIAEKYPGYQVDPSAIELNFDGNTRYYVNIENDTRVLKLKVLVNGQLEVDSRTKK